VSAAASVPANQSVLLVEDDPGDAVLVRECLAEAGVAADAITWTRTLGEALAALETVKPECVLLDLGLPDAEGYAGVRKLVDVVPDTAIIVLTGHRERDGSDALGAGAQDYLVKDTVNAELLARSMRYAVERKRAQAAQQQLRLIRHSAAEQGRLERGLLPTPLLRTDAVSCATYYRPGRDHAVLGGDFYDVVETVDGRVRAVIGDVMGHGPDEAALGVHLRVAWRTLLLAGVPDGQILPTLDGLLAAEQTGPNRFVTVCDITFEAGVVTVRVAGHPAPVMCALGESRYLDLPVGPPLGIDGKFGKTPRWPSTPVSVPPGSSLLLYTDGLLDAHAKELDGLGIEELVSAVDVCNANSSPAAAWIEALVGGAPRDSVDDIAVVVLTTRAEPGA
jgi:serine phosphatase RsbU (regulator of sigma subunit)